MEKSPAGKGMSPSGWSHQKLAEKTTVACRGEEEAFLLNREKSIRRGNQ